MKNFVCFLFMLLVVTNASIAYSQAPGRRPFFPNTFAIKVTGQDSAVLADWTDPKDPEITKKLPLPQDRIDFEKRFIELFEKKLNKKVTLVLEEQKNSRLRYRITGMQLPELSFQYVKPEGERPFPQNVVQVMYVFRSYGSVDADLEKGLVTLIKDVYEYSQYTDALAEKRKDANGGDRYSLVTNLSSIPRALEPNSRDNAKLLSITLSFRSSRARIDDGSNPEQSTFKTTYAKASVYDGREVLEVLESTESIPITK